MDFSVAIDAALADVVADATTNLQAVAPYVLGIAGLSLIWKFVRSKVR